MSISISLDESMCRGSWKDKTEMKFFKDHPFALSHTTEILDKGGSDPNAIEVHSGRSHIGFVEQQDAHWIVENILMNSRHARCQLSAIVRDAETTHKYPGFPLTILIWDFLETEEHFFRDLATQFISFRKGRTALYKRT
jgi:hypothetical protein